MKQRTTHALLKKLGSFLLISLFALNCSNIRAAHAADKDTVTIGVLDETKLSESYTKYQDAMKIIDQKAQSMDEQLKARDLLNTEEGAKFDTLMLKPNRTADEQTALEALIKSGNERRADLLALSGKATRSDEETARIKELQTTLKGNGDAVQKLQDALLKSLLEEKHSTEKTFTDLANQTVIDVAKDKKLSVVLSKSAVVWHAPSVDITDEVLKKLNKK